MAMLCEKCGKVIGDKEGYVKIFLIWPYPRTFCVECDPFSPLDGGDKKEVYDGPWRLRKMLPHRED
jgi:hypothetical protein